MNGVILLYTSGSWPLALIVLVASVIIPLTKILTLAYLLMTVQFRKAGNRRERVRLYRLVEIIGRWSEKIQRRSRNCGWPCRRLPGRPGLSVHWLTISSATPMPSFAEKHRRCPNEQNGYAHP